VGRPKRRYGSGLEFDGNGWDTDIMHGRIEAAIWYWIWSIYITACAIEVSSSKSCAFPSHWLGIDT
jgi:hypothetical protein